MGEGAIALLLSGFREDPQWRIEIDYFSERDGCLIIGTVEESFQQYDSGFFFTICNYEHVLRDIKEIEKVRWDLIILDEGRRKKTGGKDCSNR